MKKVKPLFFDSYITAVKGSVNSKLFQTLWAEVNDKKKDILQKGELSCAVFVSSILVLFDLIKERHATVKGTVLDIKKFGWKEIKKPQVGSILVWEDLMFDDGPHGHIGFYIGGKKAISNSKKTRAPSRHHWTYGIVKNNPKRKIVAIYWHSKLNGKYFK